MNIELDGQGKVRMSSPQQQWHGNAIMQTALFAGEEVMAITDDAGGFDLHYLGFKATGFASMEAAKLDAGNFVKTVLGHMTDLI